MHRAAGDHERALADHDKVVEKQPKTGYFIRAITWYRMEKYEKASADLRKALELRPDYDYLWLYLLTAAHRISKGHFEAVLEEVRAYDRKTLSGDWSRVLVRFLLGRDGMNEEQLLGEAKKGRNDREVRERLCEAYYFIAEKRLWQADEEGARAYFARTLGTRATDYIEYGNAKALLERWQQRK